MSITPVPISMRLVRAPIAASSGNGEASCRAKWWTRKYAPSAPSSSAATARSMDCSSASEAVRTADWGESVQWPKLRNPIFFMPGSTLNHPRCSPARCLGTSLDVNRAASRPPRPQCRGVDAEQGRCAIYCMPVPAPAAPIRTSLLRDTVHDRLRDAIVNGTLAPGEVVRDTEHAGWLGVSRTPVREALLRLGETGLVRSAPGRSTVVADIDLAEVRDAHAVVVTM